MEQYIAHWVIGVAAVTIWGWGHVLGVEPSLISYAAFILPSVVAAAGVQATLQRGPKKADTPAPTVQADQPAPGAQP